MPDKSRSNNPESESQPDIEHAAGNVAENAAKSADKIRQIKRAQRNTLSASIQLQHSIDLQQLTAQLNAYKNSNHIACYIANDGEIDPVKIIEHAWSHDKKVYLPVLSPSKNSLYFAPYTENSVCKMNRFGIPEPECKPSQLIKAHQLDLLLLPLVAFDASGNRVGMGGGFYDRTLAYLQDQQLLEIPELVGLAHEIQKVDRLNRQSWDIPLDYIITEKQHYQAR